MNVDYEIRTRVMNILIECRKEKGISQKELAKILDSKETTVASWELRLVHRQIVTSITIGLGK